MHVIYARIPSPELCDPSATPDDTIEEEYTAFQKCDYSSGERRGVTAALSIWAFEIMTLLTSVAAFAAIIVLLSIYHEQPQPHMSQGLNINTIIAILSTIVKATLVYVVAEVIGQSKWSWMSSPQLLRHVEYFHDAGKGAGGSLKFLFAIWKPITTALGALVIVASFAIAPFSQQAATTYPCEIDMEGNASIAVAQWVGTGADGSMPMISSETHVAAITGLIYGPSISMAAPNAFECDSGNCTFRSIGGITHSSVGVCSSCEPIEVYQETIESRIVYSLSMDTNTSLSRPNITWPLKETSNIFIMDSNATISTDTDNDSFDLETRFLTLRNVDCNGVTFSGHNREQSCGQTLWLTSGDDTHGFEALGVKCKLYPCFRNYKGGVLNGKLNETQVGAVNMKVGHIGKGDQKSMTEVYQALLEPCTVNGKSYYSSNITEAKAGDDWISLRRGNDITKLPANCLRGMHSVAFSSITRGLRPSLSGACFLRKSDSAGTQGMMSGHEPTPTPAKAKEFDINCGDKWWFGPLFNQGNVTNQTISEAHNGMAQAITNRIRANKVDPEGAHTAVRGKQKKMTICIRAEWAWLAHPGILLVVSACLLLDMVRKSCGDRDNRPMWKSSILPLLFYDVHVAHTLTASGKQKHSRSKMPLMQLDDLKSLADTTVARFSEDRERPGFVVVKEKETADIELSQPT
ncbi:hypothetical protein CCHR01_03673 [Colletotrichum chrysophilum]|uniref:Uncharacterized protein n=1 Tax=Colletotrichum chrysophilum TaxID=1836956 RepID=A0AAD9ER64_9PEZI|nr:hypothetical protein CCHR01_03673 [Colletotrichum chrysophilum]